MDKAKVREIVGKWRLGTSGAAYMAGLENRPVIARAKGSYLYDTEGKAYLDFGSGQMGGALGHNHPKIVESIKKSADTIIHSSNTYLNVQSLELHEKLGQILTPPLQKTVFLVTGSDANEGAVDMARKATGGLDVVGMHTGLHGSTSFVTRSLSFNWTRGKHALNAPATMPMLAPYCYRCPVGRTFPGCEFQCLKTSMELLDAAFTGKPAAVICEPIMSAGGIVEPPPGYMQALREECTKRGMLLINDEAQTGLGKTGKMWAHQHAGVVPDIMTVSKHFGGGVPVSAICATAEVADKAVANGYFATRSHATDPLLCAAGSASIDVVVEEQLPGSAHRIGERIKGAFHEMAKEHELIGDVRGRGCLLGVELVTDREKKTAADAETKAIQKYCEEKGLILQLRGTEGRLNVLRLVPPMTTPESDVDKGISILADAVKSVSKGRKGSGAGAGRLPGR